MGAGWPSQRPGNTKTFAGARDCEGMNAAELKAKFPNASAGFLQANTDGVCAAKPERAPGRALERAGAGKAQSSQSPERRFLVRFKCYSVRPLDWDNYRLKDLQDMLCVAGLLPDDNWKILEGHVSSHKAASPIFERTEIEITLI